MVRGYVVIVDEDSPFPEIPESTALYRKTTVKIGQLHRKKRVKLTEFKINFFINGTCYSLKVSGNIRMVDKNYVSSGLARIGFIEPNLDIVIFCDPGELKNFMYTVEVLCNLKKRSWIPNVRHVEVCKPFSLPDSYTKIRHKHFSVPSFPVYNVKILSFWQRWSVHTRHPGILDCQLGIHNITVTSYPYLTTITAQHQDLVEFPKGLGSLPCLRYLNLSNNSLCQATNWNWLTSPFVRENLSELDLNKNKLSSIPECMGGLENLERLNLGFNCLTDLPATLGGLKNLERLNLNYNNLKELPAALGSLKNLRYLSVCFNRLTYLPAWVFRKEHFSELNIQHKHYPPAWSIVPSRRAKDFVQCLSVGVPSLQETIAKFIITNSFPYWEYNIPAKLVNFLEGTYCCRCGSVVLPNRVGQVIECRIAKRALVKDSHGSVAVAVRCCSYKCHKLIKRHIMYS